MLEERVSKVFSFLHSLEIISSVIDDVSMLIHDMESFEFYNFLCICIFYRVRKDSFMREREREKGVTILYKSRLIGDSIFWINNLRSRG